MTGDSAPTSAGPIGILGGTFDPPHLAHLAIAEEAREVLGLRRVLFVPAGIPWQKADREGIDNPQAWLTTICTRRCIDLLRSAHRTRVDYVGPWLPEPIHTATGDDAWEHASLGNSLTTAFLLLLERLTPKERAAYLLHEIFEVPYPEIANALDLQEAIGQWASGDKSMARINCLAMPLPIRDGQLIADPWLFDTSDALVEIRGVVDLRSETVDVTLKPYPKDFSLFNSLTSITIKGDLAKRTASVNALEAAGKLVLKTLAAPLMTVLSGEIETEAKERTPCGRLAGEFGDVPGKDNPERNSERDQGKKR